MNLFQKYLVDEFAEDYQEGQLTRRDALKLIAAITGSLFAANTILAACAPPPETAVVPAAGATSAPTATRAPADTAAPAATAAPSETAAPTEAPAEPTQPATQVPQGTVSPDDPAIRAGDIQFPGEGATLLGYLAQPAGDGPYPVVLVCHENRGLTEHIKDVTRRLAKAGYVGLAVDLLSRQGGVAAFSSDDVPGALGNTPPEQFVQDFISAWRYLQAQPYADAERVGMVGFCFGGGVTWQVAVGMPELRAAVPFYGPHPAIEDVPKIQAPVRAIYGEQDERINSGIPAIEEAMRQNNKTYEKIIYPNAGHAFHNDTGQRYNPAAATDAWQRTLEWFGQYLG